MFNFTIIVCQYIFNNISGIVFLYKITSMIGNKNMSDVKHMIGGNNIIISYSYYWYYISELTWLQTYEGLQTYELWQNYE